MSEQDSMDIALGLSILDQLRAGQTPTLPPGGRGAVGTGPPLTVAPQGVAETLPSVKKERHNISKTKLFNPLIESFEAFEDRFQDAVRHFGWEGADKI